MSRKSLTFIAQFPPPIHGLSKAVETLWNSEISNDYSLQKVDISDNKRFFFNIVKILFSKSDLFYFTIAQTAGGNIRDLIIMQIIKWKGKELLLHLHGGYYRIMVEEKLSSFQRFLNYKALARVSGGILLSNSLRPIFEDMIPNEKIYIVPNCADSAFFLSDIEVKKKVSEIENTSNVNILYLSNFIETKGYKEVLVLALHAKEQGNFDLHFHFAGGFFSDEDRKYFDHFVQENDLDSILTYHGIVVGEKKSSLLKKCHVFILLTRYPNEGQPISILEAMANGLTIVTTNHAGIPDIVRDGYNGLIIDKNSIVANYIYNFLCGLQTDRAALQEFASINHMIATSKYTEDIYIANMQYVISNQFAK